VVEAEFDFLSVAFFCWPKAQKMNFLAHIQNTHYLTSLHITVSYHIVSYVTMRTVIYWNAA